MTQPVQLPVDVTTIQKLLPHRYPFLLVDRVIELEPHQRVLAYKNVTCNEPFFNGHFPGHPVMPGVLVIEAIFFVEGRLKVAGEHGLHDPPWRSGGREEPGHQDVGI